MKTLLLLTTFLFAQTILLSQTSTISICNHTTIDGGILPVRINVQSREIPTRQGSIVGKAKVLILEKQL
jgi:hypothetical protein